MAVYQDLPCPAAAIAGHLVSRHRTHRPRRGVLQRLRRVGSAVTQQVAGARLCRRAQAVTGVSVSGLPARRCFDCGFGADRAGGPGAFFGDARATGWAGDAVEAASAG